MDRKPQSRKVNGREWQAVDTVTLDISNCPPLARTPGKSFVCVNDVSQRVRCVPSACNVISTAGDGSATLSNYGLRRNCTVLVVYPELIDIVRMDVGQIISPSTRSAHRPSTIARATQHHRHLHAVMDAPVSSINCQRNRPPMISSPLPPCVHSSGKEITKGAGLSYYCSAFELQDNFR